MVGHCGGDLESPPAVDYLPLHARLLIAAAALLVVDVELDVAGATAIEIY